MNKIVLNNGVEISEGLISIDGPKRIYVSIPGKDIVQAALLFGDSEKTRVMICYTGVFKITYTGFTKINSIGIDEFNNTTNIYLSGEDVNGKKEYTVPEEYLPEEMRTESSTEVNENA